MEKEKPGKTRTIEKFFFWHKRVIFIFLCLFMTVYCKSDNNKNKIAFKSLEEKDRIYKNYKIWKSLSPLQKKRWILCQERFQKYSVEDKNFLRTVYRDWLLLPAEIKEEWKKTFMVFQSLSIIQKLQVQYISIFHECCRFENYSLPYMIWIKKFENLFKKYEPLPPWDLRLYIYQIFKSRNALNKLPSDFQKYWLNLPVYTKMKIFSKIEKRLNEETQSLLFQCLKQELKTNLGDE